MHSPLRVLVLGMYGAGNLGDDLLMAAVSDVVQAAGAEVVVAVHSLDAARRLTSRPAVPAPALSRHIAADVSAFLRELARSDVLVIGGGGLFQDTHYGFTVANYALPIALATALGKRVVVWGVGVGPFRSDWNRWLTRLAASLADEVTVRDPDSRQALGNVSRSIPIVSDPVWWLDSSVPSRIVTEGKAVGLILRGWPGLDLDALAAAVARVSEAHGARVLLIPFEYSDKSPRDWALSLRLRDALQARGTHVELPMPRDYPELSSAVEAVRACDAVLTMRFHGAVLALGHRVPVAALTCAPKISQLFENAGLAGRVREIADVSRGGIDSALGHLLENRERAIEEQEAARDMYLRRAGDGSDLRAAIREAPTRQLRRRVRAALVAMGCGATLTAAGAAIAFSKTMRRSTARG